jgi:large subunit ribosomal protein LP1
MSTETALAYASVILADSELEVSSENLLKLVSGANIEIDGIWAQIFSKALEGKDLSSLLFNFEVSSGPAAAAGGAGAAAGGAAAAAEEEKEEEAKEESDDDMGFGLFD